MKMGWDGRGGHSCVLRCGHRCAGRPCGPRAGEGWCGAREEAGLPPHTSTGEEDAEAPSLTPTHNRQSPPTTNHSSTIQVNSPGGSLVCVRVCARLDNYTNIIIMMAGIITYFTFMQVWQGVCARKTYKYRRRVKSLLTKMKTMVSVNWNKAGMK